MNRIEDWVDDPKLALIVIGGALALIVLFVAVFAYSSVTIADNNREACLDIGMLYNSESHGCVEGVPVP